MENIINSARESIKTGNYYGALFIALTLPDICSALGNGTTNGDLYAKWFEDNLLQYKRFCSGNDCYALRCALLHQGKDNITEQKKRDYVGHKRKIYCLRYKEWRKQ